jgi:hypothetical protein
MWVPCVERSSSDVRPAPGAQGGKEKRGAAERAWEGARKGVRVLLKPKAQAAARQMHFCG